MKKSAKKTGSLIAQILAAEWRGTLSISAAELAQVAPLLLNSGGAAWAWRQIRQTPLKDLPIAHELQQAYRLHTLHVALKEREIAQVFTHLRSQGLDPLMGKGWVIARQYPEPGLRPFGDIDLYVQAHQHREFSISLSNLGGAGWVVDLHKGAAELDDRSFDTLYAHSRLVTVGDGEARIFGPEDSLRLLCLHFLREGALRPLWLCDIAVALATLPEDFNWEYCLSGNPRRSDWMICTLELVHQLFGISIARGRITAQGVKLPQWLIPTILRAWGQGKRTKGRRKRMASYLEQPSGMLKALAERWPNPIEATIGTKGPFNNWPRLPFQIGECILRTSAFARQQWKLRS